MDDEEDYESKAKSVFKLINDFRRNPKSLAKHLEKLRTYLDRSNNVLSEPNKIQFQMVEGDVVFKEAISFLQKLSPLKPLEWDDNLRQSAQEHVNDIGPKGLLLYQSSDGTEPEDRISKYGKYVDSLGENIDFGPNDALGVIVSLTLDDGEENRPHRDNIFKSDYRKVGIACGTHKSEFQMCVMDFAYDFLPLENKQKNKKDNSELYSNLQNNKNQKGGVNNSYNNIQDNKNNSNVSKDRNYKPPNQNNSAKEVVKPQEQLYRQQSKETGHLNSKSNPQGNLSQQYNNPQILQSPYVKLSLENDDLRNMKINNENNQENEDFNDITAEVIRLNNEKRVIKKNVEVITKITYIYENGSTNVIQETKTHSFDV